MSLLICFEQQRKALTAHTACEVEPFEVSAVAMSRGAVLLSCHYM